MGIPPQEIRSFQNLIFTWWQSNRRDLPWRHTRDPYRILVSEVMLQQTQVSRVLPKYEEFLQLFPDVQALASAGTGAVLKAWKGMGYNQRALYLKRTAEAVVTKYKGKLPNSEELLTKLPGLGMYTARALMVFAFEKDVAMVDTNIRQIITHFFFDGLPQKEKVIEEAATLLVPKGRSWEWHQALMDFGALALKSQAKPRHLPGRPTNVVPFKQSDRFYRGRIIDVLRVSTQKEAKLVADLTRLYAKDKSFYERIITGLIKDGLVVKNTGILRLPD